MQSPANGTGDAMVVIDVLNDFRFVDGSRLFRQFRPCVAALARLLARARAREVPVIYANDNFGRWRSRANAVSEQIRQANPAAWAALEPIHPQPSDYFVLKPRHSAFYGTPLALLLETLDVGRLLLAGVSATSCIWFTAADAHVRGFDVVVIRDGIAASTAAEAQTVADLMQASLGAQVVRARSIRLRTPRHPAMHAR